MNARDFGVTDDPYEAAIEDVEPYRRMTPEERYAKFIDLMAFLESIWMSLDPAKRAAADREIAKLDDPGRWWERVPRG